MNAQKYEKILEYRDHMQLLNSQKIKTLIKT